MTKPKARGPLKLCTRLVRGVLLSFSLVLLFKIGIPKIRTAPRTWRRHTLLMPPSPAGAVTDAP